MKFFRNRKQSKLYKQWVKHSGLPADAIPEELTHRDSLKKKSREGSKERDREKSKEASRRQIQALYIVLAVGLLVIIVCIVLLVTKSC